MSGFWKRKFGPMPKSDQCLLFLRNVPQVGERDSIEFVGVSWGIVAQLAVFQPIPQVLDRIEHRGIGRQSLQYQPGIKLGHCFSNRISFMHRAAIPKNEYSHRNLTHQVLQKRCRTMVVEVSVDDRFKVQGHVILLGRERQGRGNGDFFTMFASLLQNGCLPLRRPCTAYQGCHQKATFVDKNQVRLTPPRFFLIRTQSDFSQAAMASGSRSRGTRSGFWGVNPCPCNQSAKYRGLNTIFHSSSIKVASREHVHNSVLKPCSEGSSCSHRRMIFSCVRKSLHGLPGTACAINADQPCSRKRANQRRTLRGSTAKKSATSSMEYPSKRRSTAKRLRYSSSIGEPDFLISTYRNERRFCGHYFSDKP